MFEDEPRVLHKSQLALAESCAYASGPDRGQTGFNFPRLSSMSMSDSRESKFYENWIARPLSDSRESKFYENWIAKGHRLMKAQRGRVAVDDS
jgi:hypothetical protein